MNWPFTFLYSPESSPIPTWKRRLFVVLLTLGLLPLSALTQASNGPVVVKVGLYLKYLQINESNSNFDAVAYYWYTTQKKPERTEKFYDSITTLEFVNAVSESDTVLEKKLIDGGKTYYKTGIIKGNFSFAEDLRDYPKDIQKIPFVLESRLSTSKDLIFVDNPDPSNPHGGCKVYFDTTISIQGKSIDRAMARVDSSTYNTDFGDPEQGKSQYSRYVATYFVKRPDASFWIKIVVPNLFLLIISYLVFFIPAKELEVAVGCTVTSLLASIALKWSIDNSLPSVTYTTSADELFYLFYFLITMALVESVITYNLNRRGLRKIERTVEMACRIAYPTILFFGITAIMWRVD